MPAEWALQGFAEALTRARANLGTVDIGAVQDPWHRLIPLVEALNWAVSIAEQWENARLGERPPILHAVTLARNRSQHQWAEMLVHEYGPSLIGWKWAELADLPGADPGHHEGETRRADYRGFLGGRWVTETLADISNVVHEKGLALPG